MNSKLVSIVIPAHNEEGGIRQCIVSLKKQTYTPIEIIVSDNGSTDATAAIAREEGVVVVSEPMPGVCAARQKGTEKASGVIVVSTDADTVFRPDWIKNIVDAFDKNPDAVAVGGTFLLDDKAPWWGNVVFKGLIFGMMRAFYAVRKKPFNLFGSNTAFKKEGFEGYNVKLNQGGDEVVLLRQLEKKGKIIFLFNNPVITSSRRLDKGFLHFMIFYAIDYFYSLATGKSMVAPRAVRMQKEKHS